MRRLNWTMIALLGGIVLLVGLVIFFATRGNPEQDKLTNAEVATSTPPTHEKLCSSRATYDLIKRELFRRAAQLRGSDHAAYDQLAAYAVARMDNPVMESEDSASGAVNCSGSLSLDLPPGVAIAGGRRTLTSDIDYTVQAGGNTVQLRNADAIIGPLATLSREAPPPPGVVTNEVASEQPEANAGASVSANVRPGPPSAYPGRPSFDCSKARSRSEIVVCSDSGLSALDVNMATQYRRALAAASPVQREQLRASGTHFYVYRDRCTDRQCIGDAYVGRMREIRDIMEGRSQPR